MKRIAGLLLIGLLAGCAPLGVGRSDAADREEVWLQAHQALAVEDFDRATTLFRQLHEQSPQTREGRESLFFLGAVRLDPRNAAWNPEPAEQLLRGYLAADTLPETTVQRRAEAQTLLELARQLNMPVDQRVPGLQPEPRVVAVPQRVTRAGDTRQLQAEVARLRRELAAREAEIQQQKEELERIRKTLTGRSGGERE